MAKTAVADIIIPTQFERYAIERTAELSAFGRCGIIEHSPVFDALAAGGGRQGGLPRNMCLCHGPCRTRDITVGQFFSLWIYSFFIFGPLQELGNVINIYREAEVSLKNFQDILDTTRRGRCLLQAGGAVLA